MIGYELLSLFVQRESGIYRLLPDFYGGNKLYTIPKHFPLSFNCYCIISSPYNTSNAYKKFDPTGGFRIFVCELSCWVIWVEYLCFSFPMGSLLWGQIIYMRLGYTFIFACRKAIRQRHSIFFFLPECLCHRHCIVFHRILARQCRVDNRTLA